MAREPTHGPDETVIAEDLTIIVPFYRNCQMLQRQHWEWNQYPKGVRIVVVDDGSPEPANALLKDSPLGDQLRVYRIQEDIPWNRNGARNLGANVAETKWIIQIDIDHILPADSLRQLLTKNLSLKGWYRFARFRCGRADETRRKDAVADDVEFAQIRPHGDSYLCPKELYWKAGGYNEDFSGCLGGGSPFLKVLEDEGPVKVLEDVCLHVYTRDKIQDASDFTLSRDVSEYKRRKAAMKGHYRGKNPLRFSWAQVL
jgi:hypothetical protein